MASNPIIDSLEVRALAWVIPLSHIGMMLTYQFMNASNMRIFLTLDRARHTAANSLPSASWRRKFPCRQAYQYQLKVLFSFLFSSFWGAFWTPKRHFSLSSGRSRRLTHRDTCSQVDIGDAATTRNEDTAHGEANVQFMIVMAPKMPYMGRG